jgi:hypothetical protein
LANPNIDAAALNAGLNGKEKFQIDGLSKLIDSHRKLQNLPEQQARANFDQMPLDQQKAHVGFFGGGPVGVLGNVLHYASNIIKEPVVRTFQAVNEVSDFMTRLYRTGAIALDQNVSLFGAGNAFDIANDKGDQVFSPNRISAAKAKFGEDMMFIAIEVAKGKSLAELTTSGTDQQQRIAASAVSGKDELFNDALAAADAAKYSPGRGIANAILPESMEGQGFLYKGISGIGDASYRIFADPTLALGKAKKAYDAGDFLLFRLLGKEDYSYGRNFMNTVNNPQAVDRVFAKTGVKTIFNQYGELLTKIDKANKSGNFGLGGELQKQARSLMPEFGDVSIKQFIDAGVKNADTAANFLKNHVDVKNILSGQAARRTPLVPSLTVARFTKVKLFTTANKVFNVDKAGQAIVKAIYGTGSQDIVTGLATQAERIGILEGTAGRTIGKIKNGSIRLTDNQISARIDRFKRKFSTVPFFDNGFFDVMGPKSGDKIKELASITNTGYHARTIKQAFLAGDEGQRKQIFKGLYNTIIETRGVTKSISGKRFSDDFSNMTLKTEYAATQLVEKVDEFGKPVLDDLGRRVIAEYNPANFNGQQVALHGWQLSSAVSVPSLLQLDRFSAHSGIINRIIGISHTKTADDITSGWVISTLAGPKFPVRNAAEDYMLNIAIGDKGWGLVKGRFISTGTRQFKEASEKLTSEQKNLGASISKIEDSIVQLTKNAELATTSQAKAKILARIETNNNLIKAKRESFEKLESKKIKFYESNLGFMNRLIGKKRVKEFQQKIAEAGGDVDKMRVIMAEAMVTNKLASVTLKSRDKELIAEFAKYGRTLEIVDEVIEGGKNTLRGGSYSLKAANDAERFGAVRAIEYDGQTYKQAGNIFTDINPVASTEARLSWLIKIALHSSDEIDSILIKNLKYKKVAIDELVDYLETNPVLKARFQLYSPNIGGTTFEHASRAYDDVLNTFSKADGTLNEKLWKKVRTKNKFGEIKLSTKNLSIDDLPKITEVDLHPRTISGPTLIPVSVGDTYASSVFNKLWDYMGEANARFSREALVFNSMLDIRKTMDKTGYTKRIMDDYTVGITGNDLVKAKDNASKHIVSIAEDMARDKVLAFVDNPQVRSQLAMAGRNFARFYRATEDFYRRIYRTVTYNPEAIVRGALTYEGIAHSGFVDTDENGDEYFFYPGLTPVYEAMNKFMRLFGVGEGLNAPMPVEFGAKLKMITPSINPDSLFPTFAGPLGAFPIKMIGNVIPQFKELEQYITGVYGVDQPMISSILPGHVNRLWQALNKDERNSQGASATRKAITYLEATGHGIQIKIDPVTGEEIPPTAGELAEFQDKLQASTFTVLGLRFILGFVAPASPSVNLKSDMADWVRANGTVSFKQGYNEMVIKYGDTEKAIKQWIKLFPDQMPYTVSESESTVKASILAVDSANDWVKDNSALLAKYPEAASFLIPRVGEFNFDTYKLLFKKGLRENKTVFDFLRETSSKKDVQIYYDKKDEYDQQMAATQSTDLKRQVRDEWSRWSNEFKGARPYLQEELSQGSDKAIQRLRALDDIRLMLNDNTVKQQPKLRKVLSDMLNTYDSYISQRDFGGAIGVLNSENYKDLIKSNANQTILALAESDPNAMAAYNSLFAPLFR